MGDSGDSLLPFLYIIRIRSVFMRRSAVDIRKSRLESMKPLEFLPEVQPLPFTHIFFNIRRSMFLYA